MGIEGGRVEDGPVVYLLRLEIIHDHNQIDLIAALDDAGDTAGTKP